MKIFVICPVRLADDATRQRLEDYTAALEKQGIMEVYYGVFIPDRV